MADSETSRDCPPAVERKGDAREAVRVWMLGGFRVSVGGRPVEERDWGRRKARNLIKLLALAPGHRSHRERVMAALWPDLDARSAANNVHRTLHFARKALGHGSGDAGFPYLRLEGDLLALCPDGPLWSDAEAFERAAAAARRSAEPAAYLAALDLYAGELLPEDGYEEWTQEKREELRQLHLALLVEMSRVCEENGNLGTAVEALRRVVSEEPTHEEAHRGLVRLLALDGRRERALLQYRRLAEVLERDLGTEPDAASRDLYEEILAGRFPANAPRVWASTADAVSPRRHNLPVPLTSFVGREAELTETKRSLAMTRFMTLTGAGGSGKTRLALEAARDLAALYPDGAWLVELAPLSDPALVPRAVAAALGVPEQAGRTPQDALAEYLEARNLLLVLDNCEHLVDAAARLTHALLGACPNLKVLATSREPLGVPGEVVWTVPTLSLPDEGAPTVGGLMRCESVRLFVERARSRLPAFELTQENAGAVARVCRKLDGIPLAIELACARMGTLAVEQVAQRLEDSLGLLTGGARTVDQRQRTMRATLAWSHELLSESERALFARLSVFAGGWTLRAAEEVCRDGAVGRDEVLDLLGRLVDKSLVSAGERTGGEVRYRMLEPVRQYGWERLQENGEGEQVRERHAGYYLALAEEAEPELFGLDQVAWLERLSREYPNLRAALSWYLDQTDEGAEGRAEMGLRLAAALGRFWGNLGSSEGREWLEKALTRGGAAPASVRAKALNEAGWIAVFHFDQGAVGLLEEALALYEGLGDKTGQASTINHLMHTVGLLGNFGRMPTLHQATLALLEEPLEDPRAAAYLHLTMGMIAMFGQDHEQVKARMEQALSLFREVGDIWGSVRCLSPMGIAALGRGDVDYAAWANEEALRLLRHLKNNIGTSTVLIQAAGVAVLRGRPARGARLFAAAQALRRSIGHPDPVLKPLNYDYEAYIAAARAELGDEAFEAAFSEGLAMSAGQAIEYALSPDEPAPEPEASGRAAGGASLGALTRRELEVALLVGRGLSNRKVAAELSISEHTVAAHVRKILKKLGLRSRTQIPTS